MQKRRKEKPVSQPLPSVFDYIDYRKFLEEYQQKRLEVDNKFTRSYICQQLGLPNTRNFFNEVIKRRNITPQYVSRFVSVFELTDEEAYYFRALVKYNQADDISEKEIFLDQLLSLNKNPVTILEADAYEFYRTWYHSAVRALLDVIDFSDNYEQLAKLLIPSIATECVRESINLLVRLQLIELNEQGFYKPTTKMLSTRPYVRDELIKQYQLQCLDLAKKAIYGKNGNLRNISTSLISTSSETLSQIEKEIQKFKSRVRTLVQKDQSPSENVYLLDIQLFPLSNVKSNT